MNLEISILIVGYRNVLQREREDIMKSLIGKNWVDAKDGKVIEVKNPANNELVDTVPSLSAEEVSEAVDYAYSAQKEWERVPIHERCAMMMKFVELVERDKDSLAKTLSDETGKPIKEAYNEINNIAIGVPAYVGRVQHDYGNLIPRGTEKGQENTIQYTIQQPLGVVVAIIPFNFPSDIFINKIPPALLMGNACILKPASVNPLTLTKYVELLVEAGVPAGVISVVHGSGSVVGKALTSNKKVNLVTLTGSTEAGIDALTNCASHLAHSSLELGGNDAFIICEDGDIDLAIEETVWGRLYNTGQVCCASKRFLVQNSIKEEYINKMHVSNYKRSRYNYLGCFLLNFGIYLKRRYKRTCSQFVAYALESSNEIILPKKPITMMPNDFLRIKNIKKIYDGELGGCCFESKFQLT